jgi:hypothetical protein
MKKIMTGLLLGLVLGALDGATSWFTPEVRGMLMQIIVGSMIKDGLVGLLSGIFALKVRSVISGLLLGTLLGFALAFLVAFLQHAHYGAILIPGTAVGAVLGYATQKAGWTTVSAAAQEAH